MHDQMNIVLLWPMLWKVNRIMLWNVLLLVLLFRIQTSDNRITVMIPIESEIKVQK